MAAEPATIVPGTVINDKYRVDRRIGAGGMGSVYLVHHLKTDERFALKVLNPSVAKNEAARERFRREARTPARIDSDHVARVVDSDIAEALDGAPYLVMEYLRGSDLQELVDSVGALPPTEVVVYLRQLGRALDRAHAIGVVHRDLKPENLFLTTRDDGSPCLKVLDFGIAKLTGGSSDLASVAATSTGDVFGTPLYMSPEQCLSQGSKISARTDVWALGLVAHFLLTGQDFWDAANLTQLIGKIAYEPIPRPSEVGPSLGDGYDAWFAQCCARDPEKRYASAGEAVETLASVLGLGALEASPSNSGFLAASLARRVADERSVGDPTRRTSAGVTHDGVPAKGNRTTTAIAVAIGAAVAVFGLWKLTADPEVGAAGDPAPLVVPSAVTPAASIESATVTPIATAAISAAPETTAEATATTSTAPPPRPTPRTLPPVVPVQPAPPPPPKPTVVPLDPLGDRH